MSTEAFLNQAAISNETNRRELAITIERQLTTLNQFRANKVFGAFVAVISQFNESKSCCDFNFSFSLAHWYLYVLGFCKEEESDSTAEMGFEASSE